MVVKAREKTCQLTAQPFSISAEEADAYRRFDLPLPSICPQERHRRRLAFCSDGRFFWRQCDATGEKIFSVFPENVGFPVVSLDYWRSAQWDPLLFGGDFDYHRSFFEQYQELWSKVPRPAYTLTSVSGSAASHQCWDTKDSFMVFNALRASGSLYCAGLMDCASCVDCYHVVRCSDCYECLHCADCRSCGWSEFSTGCEDCRFVSHCTNCRYCLFCSGLEKKEYCLFNTELGKDDYEKVLHGWRFNMRQKIDYAKEVFTEFLADKPIPHIFANTLETNSGNSLIDCRHALDCFECSDCRDIVHCAWLSGASGCLEGLGFGSRVAQCAQFVAVANNAQCVVNCVECWNDVEKLDYCLFCEKSSNLLACIGLKGKEYCILNKQYTKKKFTEEREKIVRHLKARGVWGKFFPVVFSGLAYNQTAANELMPLAKIPAQMMGFVWDDSEEFIQPSLVLSEIDQGAEEQFLEMPDRLEALTDEIVRDAIFICEMSGRFFRLTPEEVVFYRKMQIAPPSRAFEQRHRERVMRLPPWSMVQRKASRGSAQMYSTYPENWRRPVVDLSQWRALIQETED